MRILHLIWRTVRTNLPMSYSSYRNFTARMRDAAWYKVASSVVQLWKGLWWTREVVERNISYTVLMRSLLICFFCLAF